ncbi:TerD family protein [Streptomyces sp. NPDC004752]
MARWTTNLGLQGVGTQPRGGRGSLVNGLSKGTRKVEVALQWDPSPMGQPPTDLDLIAATYRKDEPYGTPDYLVHFGSRSPDGTINLNRDSSDGKGFGPDEVMTLELDRLNDRYARVVVGVVIQQRPADRRFAAVLNPAVRIREGYTILAEEDFGSVPRATAATVAEFVRDESGGWDFHPGVHGFEDDPAVFSRTMGRRGGPDGRSE